MGPIPIGVSGAAGRMGRRIIALASSRKDFVVRAALEGPRSPDLGRDAGEVAGVGKIGVALSSRLAQGSCRVLIDFSVARALPARLAECIETGTPWVVATTGYPQAFRKRLEHAAKRIAILAAPNMSLGANLLRALAEAAARMAPSGAHVEIVEAHHAAKRDAPSGTALWLAEAVERGRGRPLRRVFGRHGSALRAPDEIGIHALRAGGIAGDHTVLLAFGSERVELSHRAADRDGFAEGALAAAAFLAGRRPGRLYAMEEVLCGTSFPSFPSIRRSR